MTHNEAMAELASLNETLKRKGVLLQEGCSSHKAIQVLLREEVKRLEAERKPINRTGL